MEFQELIQRRYSVRAYLPAPIEDEKLLQVLEAARLAPTAANRQAFQIIVAKMTGREEEFSRLYHRPWFIQAPLVVCLCTLPEKGWQRVPDGKNYVDVDAAIVMDHLILAAADLGLGTCWIAAFNPQAARELFGLPAEVEPLLLTPLGYPADQLSPKQRKPLAALVRYEHW